jgi:hypothetical protein
MSAQSSSLPEVISLIEGAATILGNAECKWERALRDANLPQDAPEFAALEERLHVVTHENRSVLELSLLEIEGLIARLNLRRKYAVFDFDRFQRITEHGWSTPLVYELHQRYSSLSLHELSALIKGLSKEWGLLPRLPR